MAGIFSIIGAVISLEPPIRKPLRWMAISLSPQFSAKAPPNTFTLSTSITGFGNITLSPSGGIYDPNTVVTVTATPTSNNDFIGWGGDLSGTNNPTLILMDGNKSITAEFTQQSGGGGGPVAYEGTVSGSASLVSSVSTASPNCRCK